MFLIPGMPGNASEPGLLTIASKLKISKYNFEGNTETTGPTTKAPRVTKSEMPLYSRVAQRRNLSNILKKFRKYVS